MAVDADLFENDSQYLRNLKTKKTALIQQFLFLIQAKQRNKGQVFFFLIHGQNS